MTTPEQWPRVKQIVGAALECEPSERESFLDSACSEDQQLRAEVESLIAAYDRSDSFSAPVWEDDGHEPAETPRIIGPYRLERELGVGGMGQVWLAEQTDPVRRQVALKLIRADFYDRHIAQRFFAERQSLAIMNHPAIAKIFDAGTTPAGQPYLVMEYVDGCSITEYCDRHRLSTVDRLRLFQLVCEGVQHAHQKAIIHRDLKPSNILVTEVDDKPMPRIIDFGVAKALSQSRDGSTSFTRAGSVIGTLAYMSPEQAEGGSEDIDTRSDVYSLGVVLYELLAGALPFDPKNLTYFKALRQLREVDPPRPSARASGENGAEAVAHNRNTDTVALVKLLRGDPDAIVLKAIDKDRNRRYASPSELAADIGRYLHDEPVSAHAASVGYSARKYIRRHTVGVLVVAAGVLLLAGFAVAQTWQLRNTRRQRDRADRITEFMSHMFKVADPSESRGSTITAREILDQSSRQIETGLRSDATAQSQLMQVMAETYMGLGLYNRAHDLEQRVLDARRQSLGPNDPKTLQATTQMAEILDREGRVVEAQQLMAKTVDIEQRVVGPKDPLTLETKDDLGSMLESHAHYIEAEKLEREIIPIETRELGPAHPQTLRSMENLAMSLRGESRFADAEKIFRSLLNSQRNTLGDDHPDTLDTKNSLANMLSDQGRYAEAEVLYRETIAGKRRVLGPEHPVTGVTICNLANTVRQTTGRQAEAEALYRQAFDIELRAVGPDHGYTTRAKEGLANLLMGEHRFAESHQLLQEVLTTRERTLGPDNTDTLLTGYNLSDVLFLEKHFAESEQLIRKTFAGQSRVLDADDPDTLASQVLLARILLAENRPQDGEEFARQAYERERRLLGPEHEDTQHSLFVLGQTLAKLGRYSEAKSLFNQMIEAIAALPKGNLGDAWYDFAQLAASTGHRNDALDDLHHAVETGFDDPDFMRTDWRFASLRGNPRFAQTISVAQKNAHTAQAKHFTAETD